MAKERVTHDCTSCGFSSPKWFGRCPDCGAWSTAAQQGGSTPASGVTVLGSGGAALDRLSTGIDEVDRVLGGGFVAGTCALLAGEPGIGKSTIVLQLLQGMLSAGRKTLLVTGEESLDQVALRGSRLGIDAERFRALSTTSLEAVLSASKAEAPHVLVIDSIQTLETSAAEQGAGSVVQVRDCAAHLTRHAKESGTIVVLVGHVTKEGTVAGPKTLEHVVDVVLTLEGERTGTVRLLRAAKNRFGSCEETGVFVMSEQGLEPVADPSAMLLADRRPGVPGSVVFPGLEGTRPLMVEIQALVAKSDLAQPRRVPIGLDPRRLSLLLGVLSLHAGVDLHALDVFAAAAGGLAIKEPASDLAVALALMSAARRRPVPAEMVVMGEVGLGGEVRRVPGIERRLSEAARLGFTTALIPNGISKTPKSMSCIAVPDVLAATRELGATLHAVDAG